MSARPVRRRSARIACAVVVTTVAALFAPTATAMADPGVDPSTVDVTLAPGEHTTVTKTVTTSEVPPNPDLVFLADTTGSMAGPIGDVRTNASTITSDVLASQPTAQFAVAEYKDAADTIPFRVNQNLTGDQAAVQTGINQWAAGGGGDFPEDPINAFYRIATGDVSFRPDGTRIVAWFGDAPSHDPSAGHSLADTIAALQAANVRVVAVNVGNMDADGQASAIVAATGGVLLNNVPADQVSAAILAGIKDIEVTVTPTVTACDSVLSLTESPASVTVPSGDSAVFTETIGVGAASPGTYHCTVDFLVDGVSRGYVENTTVRVIGVSINDVTVTEGSSGTTPATFAVTLSGPSTIPISVHYATANGSATAPADYAATSGTLTFAPGEVSKPVTVPVVGDAVDELTEKFTVTLSSAVGAGITRATGTGTILDDDRDGVFSCTATALNLAGLTAAVANPADLPCADDSKTVATVNLSAGLLNINAKALTASTDLTPNDQTLPPAAGDGAVSTAKVETTTISTIGLTIQVGVIQSKASVTCVAGAPVLAGSSSIASLKINGLSVTVGSTPLTIPLVVGTLRINGQQRTGDTVIQQAIALETPLAKVVLAQSKADVHGTAAHPVGNPCRR